MGSARCEKGGGPTWGIIKFTEQCRLVTYVDVHTAGDQSTISTCVRDIDRSIVAAARIQLAIHVGRTRCSSTPPSSIPAHVLRRRTNEPYRLQSLHRRRRPIFTYLWRERRTGSRVVLIPPAENGPIARFSLPQIVAQIIAHWLYSTVAFHLEIPLSTYTGSTTDDCVVGVAMPPTAMR